MPPVWRWSAGVTAGVHNEDASKVTAHVSVGTYRDILNPMTSALGVIGEAYVGTRGTVSEEGGVDGGARLGLFSPVTRIAFGGDFNARDSEVDLFLSLIHPFQRGGVLTPGGTIRIDCLPGRGHSVGLGVRLPIGQPFLGRTRPRQDHVPLPDPDAPPIFLIPDSSLVDALSNASAHAHWMNRLTVPFTDQWAWGADGALEAFVQAMNELRLHLAPAQGDPTSARTPVQDTEAYHGELERAFSVATSGRGLATGESTPFGRETAQKAREVILEHVLLPYNRLLGQKKNPDTTRGLGASASAEFYEWLTRETSLEFAQLRATTWTFAQVLELVEEVRAYNRGQWRDSRFVWLPFQLALRPQDHDEQH
jgi:hypothetical protein